jgi:hypothetical protein
MKLEFFQEIFEKYPNIKFQENLSSGGRDVPCGQTKDMMKVMVAFCSFVNAPKKKVTLYIFLYQRYGETVHLKGR